MQQIVSENIQNLIDEGAFALDVALSSFFQGQLAKAFKAFVDWKGANYYCQDGLNSDRPECIILNPTKDFSGEILVFEPQGYSEQSIGIEGFGMNIVCDQITYRITTTDENGSDIGALQVIENCKLVELY